MLDHHPPDHNSRSTPLYILVLDLCKLVGLRRFSTFPKVVADPTSTPGSDIPPSRDWTAKKFPKIGQSTVVDRDEPRISE